MHSNVMLRFMVQAFQDPLLCSSTSATALILSTCIPSLLVFLHWVWQLQDFPVRSQRRRQENKVWSSLPIVIPYLFLNSTTAMPAAVLTNQWGSNMTSLSSWRVITKKWGWMVGEWPRARICKPFKEHRNRFPALRAGTTTLYFCTSPPPAMLHRQVKSNLGIDSWSP